MPALPFNTRAVSFSTIALVVELAATAEVPLNKKAL